ncbi:MAG: VOC family protein [Caldilineaceae bacterium]|nr:VOC family protein [Caldilineaceae bacterium]MCB9156345.1 VOC family protein [Caldilineaceae bacterium]
MIQQANYLGVVVKDLAAATAFYRDTLGLTVDEQESIPGAYTQFVLDGSTILALQATTDIPGGQAFSPALLVDNVDATYNEWQQKGVELLDEPHDMPFGRTFLLRTPEGHVLRVYQMPSPN